MPTPSDDTVPPTPPSETAEASPHNNFTSCPPDEERDHHAPRGERIDRFDTPQPEVRERLGTPDEHTRIAQEPTPEPDVQEGGSQREDTAPQAQQESLHGKGEHVEDAGVTEDPSSAVASSPEAASESDASRLTQRLGATAISQTSPADEPLYLTFPRDPKRVPPSITSSFLRPGSKFRGTQQSDRQVYDVQVEIKDVNMAESFLCGYLRIQGLTDDHPTLTTFFKGEIIGPKHLFKTSHPSWGANKKVDFQHWGRFPAYRPLAKSAESPNFTLKNYAQREHLFMRWKEYFLVPDHRVKTITGASFEGFYYICFNQVEGSVSGIYFHAKSEKYQQLELKHVEDRGCVAAMEFR